MDWTSIIEGNIIGAARQMSEEKRVLFVNANVYLPGEGGYKRTMYLFDMMYNMGREVTLLTSDFNHYKKKVRDIESFRKNYPKYKNVEFIHALPYSNNVSLRRLISEKQTAYSTVRWIKKNLNQFDVIYLNMPNMDTIVAVRDLCTRYNVKMIVDIRDLRPEVFRVIIKNEALYRFLTYPIKMKADKAYSCADELIAVSEEYLERGMKYNKRSHDPAVVYIGSALEKFDEGVRKYSKDIFKPEGEIWVTYAGTLGTSYDLETIIRGAQKLQQECEQAIRLKILGVGPEEEKLKKIVDSEHINNVDFLGFKPYEEMSAFLSKSDMTVNSLKRNASQSIINKVADYFAAGVPMLNGSACIEQRMMVEKYKVGLNYEPENVYSFIETVKCLVLDKALCRQFGKNARNLALEKFDRKTSYLEIIKRIDSV